MVNRTKVYKKTFDKMSYEEMKNNMAYGDYNRLHEVLKTPTTEAARKRFNRKNPEAIKAMQFVQENRVQLPKKYKEYLEQ
jgi:hypothetical protein